jgi:WD40 repeat protein
MHFPQQADRLAFSPDGKLLASANQTEIRVWRLRDRREIRRFGGYDTAVTALAFAPAGGLLASGHEDGTGLVWDVGGK